VTDIDPQAEPPQPQPQQHRPPQTEALLRKAIEIVTDARPVPLSASSMINKGELLELLQTVADSLPDELRSARWLLKERDDFLARVQHEGDEIIAVSRTRAQQMVQRTEVVKAAGDHARKLVADADAEARRLRLETEDWCDQKLGGFEVILQRTLRTVESGRSKLQGERNAQPGQEDEVEPDPFAEAFFDQDQG